MEKYNDNISMWVINVAMFIYILPLFKLYEDAVKQFEKRKKHIK